MLFLFRSAPEVEKRIHSKLFRKFWRSRGTKEPAYITVKQKKSQLCLTSKQGSIRPTIVPLLDSWYTKSQPRVSLTIHSNLVFRYKQIATHWFALNEFALQCMTSQLLRITQERQASRYQVMHMQTSMQMNTLLYINEKYTRYNTFNA